MADSNALSSTVGLLSHLSINELNEVLDDDTKFEAITKDAITAVIAKDFNKSEQEVKIAKNKSLAEYNLSKAEALQEMKMKLVDAYEELQKLNTVVVSKYGKLKESTNKTDSEVMIAMLQTATSEIEQETDEISEKFLNGDIKLDKFLDQYPSCRKAMHLRKAKLEKMTELVSRRMSFRSPPPVPSLNPRLSTAITQNSVKNAYPSPSPPFYSNAPANPPYPLGPNKIPYPLGPTNMPMPNAYIDNHF